jgi:hypothetical protein
MPPLLLNTLKVYRFKDVLMSIKVASKNEKIEERVLHDPRK